MGKQLMIKPEKCIGCRTCELVCSFGHDQAFNPRNANVTVMAYEEAAINIPVMCLQCEDPCCLEVCPVGRSAGMRSARLLWTMQNVSAVRCV